MLNKREALLLNQSKLKVFSVLILLVAKVLCNQHCLFVSMSYVINWAAILDGLSLVMSSIT